MALFQQQQRASEMSHVKSAFQMEEYHSMVTNHFVNDFHTIGLNLSYNGDVEPCER